jgi:predicted CopG family antitoxin
LEARFNCQWQSPKRTTTKPKLNLTVREEQRNKLEQMAAIEKRSVSNLIEVMTDGRWERLSEQQGIAYAKTIAEAMNLKVDMDAGLFRYNPYARA